MRRLIAAVLSTSLVVTLVAQAGGGEWAPLQARFLIHSQTATYPEAPTKADRVLTMVIDGNAAKELFELNGPDARQTCSTEQGDRARRKKGIDCIYTARDVTSRDGPYRCWIGLNLRTGEGDVRISC